MRSVLSLQGAQPGRVGAREERIHRESFADRGAAQRITRRDGRRANAARRPAQRRCPALSDRLRRAVPGDSRRKAENGDAGAGPESSHMEDGKENKNAECPL